MKANFNSIKVRLRLREVILEERKKLDFNSIKVRLRLVSACIPFRSALNFNSIKVRLRLHAVANLEVDMLISIP